MRPSSPTVEKLGASADISHRYTPPDLRLTRFSKTLTSFDPGNCIHHTYICSTHIHFSRSTRSSPKNVERIFRMHKVDRNTIEKMFKIMY